MNEGLFFISIPHITEDLFPSRNMSLTSNFLTILAQQLINLGTTFFFRLPKFKAAIRKEIKKFWRLLLPQRWQNMSSTKTKVEISSEGQMTCKPVNGDILPGLDENLSSPRSKGQVPGQPVFHVVYYSGNAVTMKVTDKCTQTTTSV